MNAGPASRRTSARAAPASPRIAGWLLIALALPRLVRLLYPAVWPEDDCYLQSAYAISVGLRPYLDFVQPHFPLLEWIAAAYIRLVGASHIRMEILNAVAIYVTSVLTFVLGRRAVGRSAATAAALLFACSSLVFRYHLWTREFFTAPLVLAAAMVVLDNRRAAARQIGLLAGLLVLACAIKLTAGIAAAVLIAFLVVERRPWAAVGAGAAIALGLVTIGVFCYWQYGFEFVFQTILFHFFKGRDGVGAGPLYPASILDVLAPLFAIGLIRIVTERTWNRALALLLAMVAAEYLFYGVLSPTAWGHNYLQALPLVAIVAGTGAARMVETGHQLFSKARRSLSASFRLAAEGAVIALAPHEPDAPGERELGAEQRLRLRVHCAGRTAAARSCGPRRDGAR